ncbi:MAG: hypothetical protein II789_01300 [Clostridia bacterium]|nr:hypothetical protein [Clostridia bacterium]
MKLQAGKRIIRAAAMLLACMCIAAAMTACAGDGGKRPKEEIKVTTLEDLTAAEYYKNGYTANYVAGIDQFERTFDGNAGSKTDKPRDVGIFYFCTGGQHGGQQIVNVTELIAQENGIKNMFFEDNEVAPTNGGVFFWGEPLWGYYNSADSWVIRRHLALLTEAGVDFLGFDVTNAVTYDTVVSKIMNECRKMIDEGWNPPGLVFYTNAYSHRVITHLYNSYYKKENLKDVWYYLDGKPLIIGNISAAADQWEVRSREKNYVSSELPDEILNYFTFRDSQWPSDAYKENGFPWIEWSYPAPVHNGVINVAVASHPALPMSFSVTRGAKNWGRGWNVDTKKNEPEKAYEGQFFQSTWDVAIKEDPRIVFVTGWNEWTAGKMMYDGEWAMVDLCNMEFSRDAEMMKGGYNDAFYIQLAQNIRKYKDVEIPAGAQLKSVPVTIPMTSDLSAWDNVEAVFRDPLVVNKPRNSNGAVPSLKYTQAEARNNVTEIRVAQDADNFYFMLKATEAIKPREAGDQGWMNLLIGTGEVEKKGWEGYEFAVGRGVTEGGALTVEKLSSDFTSAAAGEAEFRVDGSVMQVKIPRAALGMASDVNRLYFKLADGIEHPSDIMDYYISGKSLPLGRLSFRYLG